MHFFYKEMHRNIGNVTIDLGEEIQFNCIRINEKLRRSGQQVKAFSVEIWENDAWREISRSTTIGARKILVFPAVNAQKVRVNILSAKGNVTLSEIQIFNW